MTSFRSQVGPLLFLVGIFFLNFLSRIILAPLMPTIEKDLRVGHGEAGSLFFMISLGYCLGLLASGFISSRLNHRRTIILSSIAIGTALLFVSISHSLWAIRFGFIFVGIAAGFYLPSGIATLTHLVSPEHWGKAIAIHEIAPNLGFVMAPLTAEVLLGVLSWRGVLGLVGITAIFAGGLFAFWGKGGAFFGEALSTNILRGILVERSFWIMVTLFAFGVGASLGIYSMIPLFLVSERSMEQSWANTLLGLSRILTMGTSFISGWFADRFGPRLTLMGVFMVTGLATMLLGLVSGHWIVLMVFLQPVLATSFFPPGFAAISKIGGQRAKNVSVSLTVPVAFLLGGGVVSAGIGIMGEMGSFSLGIVLFGGVLLGGAVLARYLKFSNG
jgi:NNP family nitrate/nitrite transporter-like MFS transporter